MPKRLKRHLNLWKLKSASVSAGNGPEEAGMRWLTVKALP